MQFLDAHPEVAMAPEALFVVSLFRRYRRSAWDDGTVRRFSRDLWREERLRRWGLDPEALERDLLMGRRAGGYAEMCARVYEVAAARRGRGSALRLGDKNPRYALFVPTLAGLFPRARFLHVVRDYRDNVLSYLNVPFDASSVPVLAERWRLYNEAVLPTAAATPDRFLRVRFEDLVASPESCLRRVCDFIGVRWTPSLLTGRQVPSYGLLDWHRKLAEPVDPGRPASGGPLSRAGKSRSPTGSANRSAPRSATRRSSQRRRGRPSEHAPPPPPDSS